MTITTTPVTIPLAYVDDCVEFVQFAAYVGIEDMAAMWDAAGHSEARLRENCISLGRGDPAALAEISRRRDELEAFFGVTTTDARSTTATGPRVTGRADWVLADRALACDAHVPQHHHPPRADPGATAEEIEAAARQYVRKISGVQSTSAATVEAFERAVVAVTAATTQLLAELPPRKQPPPTLPPLRRIAARKAGVVTVSA